MCDDLVPKQAGHGSNRVYHAEWVWDALAASRSIGRIAVAVRPGQERTDQAREECSKHLPDEVVARPARWTPEWREALVDQVANLLAGSQLPGDWFPALDVPRFVHGESQGICDLFGASVELQFDGKRYVRPLSGAPSALEAVTPQPLESSMFWGAVEWIRYAKAASRGRFPFRNPVMTGPFDTANYLLGSTRLLEWVYTEPRTLHQLLEKITDVIVAMINALRDSAGGTLHPRSLSCVRNLFCLCSECRSLVSAGMYEEFEAPYLRRIGEQLGPYGIHSCGSWERTVASAIGDPNLRVMNGQVRENDLAKLCSQARGRVTLSIGPSQNVDDRYTWPDTASFFEYVLATVPNGQPVEVAINESDWGLWNDLHYKIRGERFWEATDTSCGPLLPS